MPIYTHERSFGAMNSYSQRPNAFSADYFAIAAALAAHLAVALSDSKEIQDRGIDMVSQTVVGQAEGF